METINKCEAWNKGNLVGQKPPLKPKDIWAIRIYLQNAQAPSLTPLKPKFNYPGGTHLHSIYRA